MSKLVPGFLFLTVLFFAHTLSSSGLLLTQSERVMLWHEGLESDAVEKMFASLEASQKLIFQGEQGRTLEVRAKIVNGQMDIEFSDLNLSKFDPAVGGYFYNIARESVDAAFPNMPIKVTGSDLFNSITFSPLEDVLKEQQQHAGNEQSLPDLSDPKLAN